jgi:hypothetical protein
MIVRVNNTAKLKGAIGIYLTEKEVNIILPDNQPNVLKDAIKMMRKRRNSFLFIYGTKVG